MAHFVGRERELTSLAALLARVRGDVASETPGRCLLMRGRRRVGKSRLVEKFLDASGCPSLFFTASRKGNDELGLFIEEFAASTLSHLDLAIGLAPSNWDAALRVLASALADDEPSVVVFDEFPYLLTDDPTTEATFQKIWDRVLSRKPVLLILVGSDLAMMETLNAADRAFYQRGTEMVVGPLSPVETATIVGAPTAADAFDAYLITGGLPLICEEWPDGAGMWDYLEAAVDEPTSALVISAERVLAAEFPVEAQARHVLEQIGSGERTFSNIARAGGGMQQASLSRSLDILAGKRIVLRETPLSTRPSKEARYRVAEPYLGFWLTFIGPHLAEIDRGRGDRVLDRIRSRWPSWRGRAVEPVIREAVSRLLPVRGLPDAQAVGGYWTRSNKPEIDIVGADRSPIAGEVAFTGTIKWLDNALLTQADVNELAAGTPQIPGADATTPLLAISRTGVAATGVAAALGPEDLIAAW